MFKFPIIMEKKNTGSIKMRELFLLCNIIVYFSLKSNSIHQIELLMSSYTCMRLRRRIYQKMQPPMMHKAHETIKTGTPITNAQYHQANTGEDPLKIFEAVYPQFI